MKIIASLLLALSFSASAESTYLYTEVSQPDETMDDFVLSLVDGTHKETLRLKSEICGIIETNGSSYRLRLYTSNIETACHVAIHRNDGAWQSTGISFHTHLIKYGIRLSQADYLSPGYMARGKMVIHHNGPGTERWVRGR